MKFTIENSNDNPKSDKDLREDEAIATIKVYVENNSISDTDVLEAYARSLSNPREEDTKEVHSELAELEQKLREYADAGFAISRIPSLIDEMRKVEKVEEEDTGAKEYVQYVSGLNTSEREKELLTSLGAEGRVGTLHITNRESGLKAKIEILPKAEQKAIYPDLQDTIEKLGEGELEISFES